MKITKYGHCCLLIEINGKKILTDPGAFSDKQDEVKDIDIVVITHEHQDHLHVDSMQKIMANNPHAKVITNSAVNKILSGLGISSEIVEHGGSTEIDGMKFEGFGKDHAVIYKTMPTVENTGYFINEELYYPGDGFYNPGKPVEVLALPVAGPWLKTSEYVDYAIEVKPKKAFPVHDAFLSEIGINFTHMQTEKLLKEAGIAFTSLKAGETKEF